MKTKHNAPISFMTLLDYYAAGAMQSYMRNCDAFKVNEGYIAESCYTELSKFSYDIAEAMLAERTKRINTKTQNDEK